ncbi:UDP-N-acetylmuramate dehydrogenase [Candidatus Koribacter versatilis Ellin345]|uniref:UDP-N-acetylenolpyruvoylglucosamine reductase n=1 Tax=Koribacter versatilis (strain Ellin345) TaxID=204669 RepID=Q1IQH0_KORVE|nr:UDP-N-acetylmuramate dehydrogenase [Candidatus Koribacter versatilis]ABF40880.1 UDP-N-acetylmuramate dehydrogenase [Candidatus Koribacter versatilis Ellin345]
MHTLKEQVPLAPFTTLGVGGRANLFAEVTTEQEAREVVEYAKFNDYPLFVLGGGSNVVISDLGWPGIVMHVKIKGISQHREDEHVVYEAGAGEDWDTLVATTVAQNYGGLECMSGIPGSVGGTPVQNVGAYGQEVSDTIYRVTVVDRETAKIRNLTNTECGFTYRSSIFNTTQRDRYVVLKVGFSLQWGAAPKLEYADLKAYFDERSTTMPKPTLSDVREAVREIRRAKSMVLVEGDPNAKSVGSFFKNPVVPMDRFLKLDGEMQARGLQMPSYPADEGYKKLSAAWLVEKAGFHKGYVHGNVGISTKHSLAIINRGEAKASEIQGFMGVIRDTVATRFGLDLVPEPVFVGFDQR